MNKNEFSGLLASFKLSNLGPLIEPLLSRTHTRSIAIRDDVLPKFAYALRLMLTKKPSFSWKSISGLKESLN